MDCLKEKDKKYYVYRFINKDNVITYVGKTQNLYRRFLQHDHLSKDISRIEYIECDSEAEMTWKEVYYINLFYNELSTNVSDVYLKGKMKDIGLDDNWIKYKKSFNKTYKVIATKEKYLKYAIDVPHYNYCKLIHIIDHNKLNEIGKDKYAISQKWFINHRYDGLVDKLRRNTMNFFRNLTPSKNNNISSNNLWTTYDEFKENIKGKGYTKSYVELGTDKNIKNTNKIYLAYLANNFYPAIKNSDYEITEEEFALSELLQFIFQSAIRNGEEIYIYIPSVRMRNLLKKWINENSLEK